PEGLRAALEDLAARTREQAGVACALECAGPVELADGVTATHLFRIAQEAVSNALRHARPRQIRIGLAGGPAALTLAVRDDGVGIPEPAGEEKGLGIRLMRHRAGVIGGTLAVGAAEGGGTLVTCTLPRGNGNA
ncbi:MAG TPA: ATP-binding protein, partial [Gemmataceae bacterium]